MNDNNSEALPPLNAKKSDMSQVSQIRSEMMKLQQGIQRLSNSYNQIESDVPRDLCLSINKLDSNTLGFEQHVRTELSRDWIQELNQIDSQIVNLSGFIDKHIAETKVMQKNSQFVSMCGSLERNLKDQNSSFLGSCRNEVDSMIREIASEFGLSIDYKIQQKNEYKFSAKLNEIKKMDANDLIQETKFEEINVRNRVEKHNERVLIIQDMVKRVAGQPPPIQVDVFADAKQILIENKQKFDDIVAKMSDIESLTDCPASEDKEDSIPEIDSLLFDHLMENKSQLLSSINDFENETNDFKDRVMNNLDSVSIEMDNLIEKVNVVNSKTDISNAYSSTLFSDFVKLQERPIAFPSNVVTFADLVSTLQSNYGRINTVFKSSNNTIELLRAKLKTIQEAYDTKCKNLV